MAAVTINTFLSLYPQGKIVFATVQSSPGKAPQAVAPIKLNNADNRNPCVVCRVSSWRCKNTQFCLIISCLVLLVSAFIISKHHIRPGPFPRLVPLFCESVCQKRNVKKSSWWPDGLNCFDYAGVIHKRWTFTTESALFPETETLFNCKNSVVQPWNAKFHFTSVPDSLRGGHRGLRSEPVCCVRKCWAGSSSQHPSLDTSGTSEAANFYLKMQQENVGHIHLCSDWCMHPACRVVLLFYSVRTQ